MSDTKNRQRKLVILDRDGVINHDSDSYIKSPEEWSPIAGSLEGIALLSQAGFLVSVATNQSGIARNLFDEYTLARIHQKMCAAVEHVGGVVDGVFYCPHGPQDGCNCRKPRSGLLEEISEEFDIPLRGVPLVGDSLRDVEAARQMGCKPYLVKTGKGMQTLATCSPKELTDVRVVDSLLVATKLIISES